MAELKLMVELSAEDRARLDAILEQLKSIHPDCSKCTAIVTEAVAKTITEEAKPAKAKATKTPKAEAPAPAEEHPVENPFPEPQPGTPAAEEPVPFPEPEEVKPAKVYTLDDVRALVMSLSRQSAETKEKVKAIVTAYAPKVTQISADDYPALMEKLEALNAVN